MLYIEIDMSPFDYYWASSSYNRTTVIYINGSDNPGRLYFTHVSFPDVGVRPEISQEYW